MRGSSPDLRDAPTDPARAQSSPDQRESPEPDAADPDAAGPDAAEGSLDSAFAGARRATGLRFEHMRAQVRKRLFAKPAEPVRMDRFVILDQLGRGGMGVVYRAYDPKLDRSVALKLIRRLHGDISEQARVRLLREARALARLSHPNVVSVYDVGVLDVQVFMVMEFVKGQTLRQWAAARSRGWRAIVDAYIQAARGLHAAHQVGLVHRDFKPDNASFGDDGRIQVLDFGLAREYRSDRADGQPDAPALPAAERQYPAVGEQLTAAGQIMGTPAYMAPEQYLHGQADAASDQFSLCVSLYEALYGVRPFLGREPDELAQAIARGTMVDPPADAPAPGYLRKVLRRGLSLAPDDRYPSMNELIAALDRDRLRARRNRVAALGLATLCGLSAYLLADREPATQPPCQGAKAALQTTWNDQRRTHIDHSLQATGHRYAAVTGPRLLQRIDDYAAAWTAMHESACLAHHRGEQSGELLDARMGCLSQRRVALDSALAVVAQTEQTSTAAAVDVINGLPAIGYCADAAALAAEVPPPDDPARARELDRLAGLLTRVVALEQAGRYPEAIDGLAALEADAARLGYRPLTAELALVRGRITLAHGKREDAVEPLRQAAVTALGAGAFSIGLEAIARRVFVEGTWSGFQGDALAELEVWRALVSQRPDARFAHALLLNNAGVVHMARSQPHQARSFFQQAAEVNAGDVHEHPELVVVGYNLGLVSDDVGQREQLTSDTATTYERLLGPEHPRTLRYQRAAASFTVDPRDARRRLHRVYERLATYHPDAHPELSKCAHQLGLLAVELGQENLAQGHFERAKDHFEAARRPVRAALARGLAYRYGGQHRAARAALREGRDRLPLQPEEWWDQRLAAEFDLALGTVALLSADHPGARPLLERALTVQQRITQHSHKTQVLRHVAESRLALATALWGPTTAGAPGTQTGGSEAEMRTRAQQLVARAEDWYRSAGPGYDVRLQQVSAWRSARGLRPPEPTTR